MDDFDPKAVLDAVLDSFMERHGDEIAWAMANGDQNIAALLVRLVDEDIEVRPIQLGASNGARSFIYSG